MIINTFVTPGAGFKQLEVSGISTAGEVRTLLNLDSNYEIHVNGTPVSPTEALRTGMTLYFVRPTKGAL